MKYKCAVNSFSLYNAPVMILGQSSCVILTQLVQITSTCATRPINEG